MKRCIYLKRVFDLKFLILRNLFWFLDLVFVLLEFSKLRNRGLRGTWRV
jgi:hypothetical protein